MGKASPAVKSDNDWEVDDALRTLIRAEEIRNDPVMMKKVEALAAKKTEDMKSAGIIKRTKAKS